MNDDKNTTTVGELQVPSVQAVDKVLPAGKPSCPKCYGRGYMGWDFKTKQEILCPCVVKVMMKKQKEEMSKKVKLDAQQKNEEKLPSTDSVK